MWAHGLYLVLATIRRTSALPSGQKPHISRRVHWYYLVLATTLSNFWPTVWAKLHISKWVHLHCWQYHLRTSALQSEQSSRSQGEYMYTTDSITLELLPYDRNKALHLKVSTRTLLAATSWNFGTELHISGWVHWHYHLQHGRVHRLLLLAATFRSSVYVTPSTQPHVQITSWVLVCPSIKKYLKKGNNSASSSMCSNIIKDQGMKVNLCIREFSQNCV